MCSLSYIAQAYLPRDGVAHSDLGPPTSTINQKHSPPQTCPQVRMMEAVPPLRLSLLKSAKLTTKVTYDKETPESRINITLLMIRFKKEKKVSWMNPCLPPPYSPLARSTWWLHKLCQGQQGQKGCWGWQGRAALSVLAGAAL